MKFKKIGKEIRGEYFGSIGFGVFFLALAIGFMVGALYHGLSFRPWLVHWGLGVVSSGFCAGFLARAEKIGKSS